MNYPNLPRIEVRWVDPKSLVLPNRRMRRHTAAKLRKLKRSIDDLGQLVPLLVDENSSVLAGVARCLVALESGTELVPVIDVTHLSEGQKQAFMVADARLTEEAEWDRKALKETFVELIELGIDLELTAFDTYEIDLTLAIEDSASDDDDASPVDCVELPGEGSPIVSRLGDLWHCDAHRLLCGSAISTVDVEKVLAGRRAQQVVTDPPFGNAIENNVSGLGKVKHANFVQGSGEQSYQAFSLTLLRPAFKAIATHAEPGAIAFVFTDWRALPHMLDAAGGVFHEQKNLLVWAKTNAGMGAFYRSMCEFILAFKVNPGKHINNFGLGEKRAHRSTLWTYPGANTFRKGRLEDLQSHPTIKPVQLLADAILDCSKPGGVVLDPFLGSGSTLLACAKTGRQGCGIELDPKYVDLTLKRLWDATGIEPLLNGEVPFSEVAQARAKEAG